MINRIPCYGMAFHSIHYWQRQAENLYRYNGIYDGRDVLETPDQRSSCEIGRYAIAFAYVASPEHLHAVLTGTRGRRWTI